MKKTTIVLLLVCSLSPVAAQSLAECIRVARENNLDMRVADLQVQRASRMEDSWFAMEKTVLSLSQDPTSGGSPDNALTLSQRFDFPTLYGARRRQLKAETQMEASRRGLVESELARDVATAYCTLLLWQHVETLLAANDTVLEAFVSTADIRLHNGETNQLELMDARRMLEENRMRLREARDAKTASTLLLQQLMNTPDPVAPDDDYQCIQPDSGEWSFSSTPQGQLAESEQLLSRHNLGVARQEMLPSLDVGLRYQCVIPGINPYDVDRSRFDGGNWMGFEVGLSFPLFYQRARRDAAKMDVDIAQSRRRQAERQADAELLIARGAVATARRTYEYYRNEGLATAREMRRLSRLEYEAGEIGYVEHVQHLASALDIELAGAKAIDTLNQAIIQLNFIKGAAGF